MKNSILTLSLVSALFSLFLPNTGEAHCQVPCGIYGDQMRFESMLEDQTTIAKAGSEISKFAEDAANGVTPLAANQVARWVATKEDHAQRIQDTIASYFMAQRLKSDGEGYAEKLMAAHSVMTAAMKAKQDPSAEIAEALKTAIFDFYRAYEGKEPDFESHSH